MAGDHLVHAPRQRTGLAGIPEQQSVEYGGGRAQVGLRVGSSVQRHAADGMVQPVGHALRVAQHRAERLPQRGEIVRVGGGKGRPVERKNDVVGGQHRTGQQRYCPQWVLGEAGCDQLAIRTLHGIGQCALDRVAIDLGQHRQPMYLLERADSVPVLQGEFGQQRATARTVAGEGQPAQR